MRAEPPAELTALLERLHLATAAQVRAEHARVSRLARDLPLFESVWVDALAQARLLTPFQAAEINAGRGEQLLVGPYVLYQRLTPAAAWEWYVAREVETSAVVRLAVFPVGRRDAKELLRALEKLVIATGELASDHLAPAIRCGITGETAWVACRQVEGPTAAAWLVEHGRLPPEAVLEMARQMVAELAILERAGVCHADVHAGQLTLGAGGRTVLMLPGLRAILRPEEGYAHTDLAPEAYEGLAPERVERGTPPNNASDLFACGCAWWHLLAGRSPLAGGNGLAKVKAAHAARIDDVTRIAPDTPQPLAVAIAACTQRDPQRRPDSFAALATSLGPPTRTGRGSVAACMARHAGHRVRVRTLVGATRWSDHAPVAVAALAGCLLTAAVVTWPHWGRPLVTSAKTAVTTPHVAAKSGKLQKLAHPPALAPLDVRPTTPSSATLSLASGTAHDGAVVPASATAPVANDKELLLPTDRPLRIAALDLRPGQTVRGVDGRRPLLLIPATGVSVAVEDVRFAGVDFVIDGHAGSEAGAVASPLTLQCWRTSFVQCSFQSLRGDHLATAIAWLPADAGTDLDLPTGVLRFEDCVFTNLTAAIEKRSAASLSLELKNTLCLGPGSLLRLPAWPSVEQAVTISMNHSTLREAGALVECHTASAPPLPGRLTVHATDCVLFPSKLGGVFYFAGPEAPDPLMAAISWTGQGSVLGVGAQMLAWLRSGATRAIPLADAELDVAGLVRNDAGFAGAASADPGSSRIVRWQVPLHSADPPGVREAGLALPNLRGERR
ncbi:MAG: protein kinase [Pirellulales bacterium]|nr:protein kinase [Pirellulales bacterium]